MKSFKDNADRDWIIAINIDAIKRIKIMLGIDLMEAVEGKLLHRLIDDPVLLCDVIYCLCKSQADVAGVSDEDFGRGMAGDAIDLATTAMLEELVDFFPSRRRGLLLKALEKFRSLETAALSAASKRLDSPELTSRLQETLDKAFQQMAFGEPSTSSPALPAQTQAP
jgi:hypothetical protein